MFCYHSGEVFGYIFGQVFDQIFWAEMQCTALLGQKHTEYNSTGAEELKLLTICDS